GLEGGSRRELHALRRRDLYRFARARVAPRARGTRRTRERTEAGQRDLVIVRHSVLDGADERVQRALSIGFVESRLVRNAVDEFCLGHACLRICACSRKVERIYGKTSSISASRSDGVLSTARDFNCRKRSCPSAPNALTPAAHTLSRARNRGESTT